MLKRFIPPLDDEKRHRSTKDETNIAKLGESIEKYGLEGTRKLIEKGKASAGIQFDLVITKEDLKDEALMGVLYQLMAAQAGITQTGMPKGAKNIQDAMGIMDMLNQLGIKKRQPEGYR